MVISKLGSCKSPWYKLGLCPSAGPDASNTTAIIRKGGDFHLTCHG